jgi:hypothetical protein
MLCWWFLNRETFNSSSSTNSFSVVQSACLEIMMSTFSHGMALLMALAKILALSVGKCSGFPLTSRYLETMYGLILAVWILPTCFASVAVAA